MKRELTWFQQNFEMADSVRYNVRTSREGRAPFGDDLELTNTELQSNASSRGRSTWDERDIIELHGTKYAEVITLATPPVRLDTTEPE